MLTFGSKYQGYKLILCGLIFFTLTNSCESPLPSPSLFLLPDYTGQRGKINDIEGNIYKTIGIGTQIWMAENLRSTRLNDSTEITNIKDSLDWVNLSSPGYCWYNNDSTLKIPYGALYNWYAIKSGKICPTRWHIPTEEEWTILINRLGGEQEAGGKLKVIGTDYWNSPNRGATNSSHFNAVPSGSSYYNHYWSLGEWCYWWSITEIDTETVTKVYLINITGGAMIGSSHKDFKGLSVRCVKDRNRLN